MIDKEDKIKCYLRKAVPEDVNILYEWANDYTVRQSAFDSHKITYEEHVAWFNRVMNDPNLVQYILMIGDSPSGQIRLSIMGEKAEIDYSISNNTRGFGYGKEILRLAIERIRDDYPEVKRLIGRIKSSNVASFYCFIKNGFEEKVQQLEYDMTQAGVIREHVDDNEGGAAYPVYN